MYLIVLLNLNLNISYHCLSIQQYLIIQLKEFLATCKYNRDELGYDFSWLPKFLEHLYGRERALRLLRETGMP